MINDRQLVVETLLAEGILARASDVEGLGDMPSFMTVPAFVSRMNEPGVDAEIEHFYQRVDQVRDAIEVMRSTVPAAERIALPADIDAAWFVSVLLNGTPNMTEAQRFVAALDAAP